jgi:putative peptidoglycan lipid II flippase
MQKKKVRPEEALPTVAGEAEGQPPVSETPESNLEETHQSMMGSAFVVGLMTLLSRLTGLWRFRVMGHFFGATGVADAFNFAFIFPNLTRRLFGEGLLTSVFVPVFSERLAKGEKEAACRSASVLLIRLFYWLSIACVALIGVSFVARTALAGALHLSPTIVLELKLFEALLPYCVLINVAAVLMAILNSMGHFWMPAFAPVLLNVLMILACYFGLGWGGTEPEQQIWIVAGAVLLGGVMQIFVQLPPAFAKGFRFTPTADSTDPGYREVMSNFKAVALLVAAFQLNVLMDNVIAEVCIPGSGPVTYMNMGTSVYQMAWALIALAIGVAALPLLSRQWARGHKSDFQKTLTTALRYALFASLPCAIGAMLLSNDIVRLLYGTGKFLANNGEPVHRTAGVVFYSCAGLLFYSVNSILVRALYAMKEMRLPTKIMFQSVALNFGLNLFFVLACPWLAQQLYPSVKGLAGKPGFYNDIFEALGALSNLRESGITLASTISTAWQTWALSKAVRARLDDDSPPALTRDFALMTFGTAIVSSFVGLAVYRQFTTPDAETLYGFGLGAAAFLAPPIYIGYEYFHKRFDAIRERHKLRADEPFPDDAWPETLKLQYAIYTSLSATLIMGLVVWACRESLPPEAASFGQAVQRAVVPVAVGVIAYSVAAGALVSREYEELKAMLARKFGRK